MRSEIVDNKCYESYLALPPNGMVHEREGRQKFKMLNMRPLLKLWRM
jgi:hypothetical protein